MYVVWAMKINVTEEAVLLAKRKGGKIALDFIAPVG